MPHQTILSAPNSAPESRRVHSIDIAPATLATIVLMVAGVALLSYLIPVILVLIAALMLVGSLNPAVERLEHQKVHRFAAIAIVFSVLLLILAALAVFTVPAFVAQVSTLVDQEPQMRERLVKFLSAHPLTGSLAVRLRQIQYASLFKSYSREAMAVSRNFVEIIAYGAGSFFLAFYIMIDRDRLRGALFAVVPRAQHIKLSRIMLKLQTIVGGYVRGQVITCAIMAVFLFVVLSVCGVPNAIAIAAFGGIADVLPFIGIFFTIVPAVLAAYAVSGVTATVMLALLLVYAQFENRVLIPVVYGRSLRLPSSIILFSLITGGTLYGIAGALLALPVAATLLMLIDELKVDMPGETMQPEARVVQEHDNIGEAEYLRRTDGMTAKDAAGIALEISEDRESRDEEASVQALKDARVAP